MTNQKWKLENESADKSLLKAYESDCDFLIYWPGLFMRSSTKSPSYH